MASADSKPPIGFEPLTKDERKSIMDLVPKEITKEESRQLEIKMSLPVGLRHTGLVNALNHLKPILSEDHRPDDFYNIAMLTRLLNKRLPLGTNIQNAIHAYNNDFTDIDAYWESRKPIKLFYEKNIELTPIPDKVISAFSLDKFEIFAHTCQLEVQRTIQQQSQYVEVGGRIGKYRSSKKRSRRLRHKSATKSRRPHHRRRRTSRK